jgi:hypothetical protein
MVEPQAGDHRLGGHFRSPSSADDDDRRAGFTHHIAASPGGPAERERRVSIILRISSPSESVVVQTGPPCRTHRCPEGTGASLMAAPFERGPDTPALVAWRLWRRSRSFTEMAGAHGTGTWLSRRECTLAMRIQPQPVATRGNCFARFGHRRPSDLRPLSPAASAGFHKSSMQDGAARTLRLSVSPLVRRSYGHCAPTHSPRRGLPFSHRSFNRWDARQLRSAASRGAVSSERPSFGRTSSLRQRIGPEQQVSAGCQDGSSAEVAVA